MFSEHELESLAELAERPQLLIISHEIHAHHAHRAPDLTRLDGV
ncbi:MAG: hypothetical protein Q8L00_00510 [Deltaproteobacteria bacterium]|nr:hypothetical protein [Deltaproteobacteria bacterium]